MYMHYVSMPKYTEYSIHMDDHGCMQACVCVEVTAGRCLTLRLSGNDFRAKSHRLSLSPPQCLGFDTWNPMVQCNDMECTMVNVGMMHRHVTCSRMYRLSVGHPLLPVGPRQIPMLPFSPSLRLPVAGLGGSDGGNV